MCIPFRPKHLRNHSCGVSDALWHTICILETADKVPGNSQEFKISWNKSSFSICSSILTNLHNHSWALSDILWHRIYSHELRFSIRSIHGPSKSTKCKKYGNHRASATFSRMEHIFKTLKSVILGLQNFPGPLAHTIRTGTYQSPPGTVLEQIWPQEAEQSRFLSKYFWKIRLALLPRFARLLSYKVLLFERRWISVSTSHLHARGKPSTKVYRARDT